MLAHQCVKLAYQFLFTISVVQSCRESMAVSVMHPVAPIYWMVANMALRTHRSSSSTVFTNGFTAQ